MKMIIHVCLPDAEPVCASAVPLPGGLIAQCWWIVEPTASAVPNTTVAARDYRIFRKELAKPGITYECASMEEAAEVLRRELNDVPCLM